MWMLLVKFMWLWLIVGFLVGFSEVFLGSFMERFNRAVDSGEFGDAEEEGIVDIESIRHSKAFFLGLYTLFGLFSLLSVTLRLLKRNKWRR